MSERGRTFDLGINCQLLTVIHCWTLVEYTKRLFVNSQLHYSFALPQSTNKVVIHEQSNWQTTFLPYIHGIHVLVKEEPHPINTLLVGIYGSYFHFTFILHFLGWVFAQSLLLRDRGQLKAPHYGFEIVN